MCTAILLYSWEVSLTLTKYACNKYIWTNLSEYFPSIINVTEFKSLIYTAILSVAETYPLLFIWNSVSGIFVIFSIPYASLWHTFLYSSDIKAD